MPGHNGFRFDDDESISPARVYAPERPPKEAVQPTESGSRLLSLEDSKLLSESSGFQGKPVTHYEQRTDIRGNRNEERAHRTDLSRETFGGNEPGLNPLILLPDQVLMTHSLCR